MKKTLLFICTHNANRSQLAQGLLQHYYGKHFDVYSAGTAPTRINPLAIQALAKVDIDIRHQQAKSIAELPRQHFDFVVTVCDDAQKSCPHLRAKQANIHHAFPDPSKATGSKEDILRQYCQVGELIKQWLDQFVAAQL